MISSVPASIESSVRYREGSLTSLRRTCCLAFGSPFQCRWNVSHEKSRDAGSTPVAISSLFHASKAFCLCYIHSLTYSESVGRTVYLLWGQFLGLRTAGDRVRRACDGPIDRFGGGGFRYRGIVGCRGRNCRGDEFELLSEDLGRHAMFRGG